MILNYTPEQYQEAAKRMTWEHNDETVNDEEAQVFLVAASACLEVQQLQKENRELRQIAGEAAHALLEQMGLLE